MLQRPSWFVCEQCGHVVIPDDPDSKCSLLARKLADLLRLNDLEPVYHGETGVRMLRELARSYLTIDLIKPLR
jgi:hypothetical protein